MKKDVRITYDLVEMLQLRAKGWTHRYLAERFGRERTTLLHQCKKWGVEVGSIVTADADGMPVVYNPPNVRPGRNGFKNDVIRVVKPKEAIVVDRFKKIKSSPKRLKYAHLIEDSNPGKSYKEYLEEAKQRALEGKYIREHRLDHKPAFTMRSK